MKKLLLFLLFIPNLAFAQVTQQEVLNNIASNLPTNNANEISALALRNTLGYMTSAIFEGVPPQSGTVCPPPTGLFPYQFFINTNGSPTNIVYNIFDGVSCVQWGVLNQTAHTFQGLFGGGLEVSGPLSASGPFSAAPTQFLSYLTQGPTGNIGGLLVNLVETGTTNANQTQWNQFNCIDAFSDTGGHPANNCVAINHVLNSTLVEGGRQALGVVLSLNSPTNPANSLTQYVAVVGEANAVSGDQGTSLTPRGILYASNFIVRALPTASYLFAVTGGENDMDIQTSSGTAPYQAAIFNLNTKLTHSAHAQMYDGALVIGAEVGSVGMLNGVLFSSHFNSGGGTAPIAPTGTLMATEGAWAVANGIDLSSVTISTCSLKLSYGCILDGNSNLTVRQIITGSADQSITGAIVLEGGSSGAVTIQPQAAAGTYNFNLPITAGTSGYVLTSAGGGSSAMTWTIPSTTVNGQTCTLASTCTVAAAAETLTGTTLAANVVASSLTSVGTLTSLSVTGNITSGNHTFTTAAPTVSAAQVGLGSTVVAAGSGNCPTGTVGTKTVAGCLVANVAGSTAVIPYF